MGQARSWLSGGGIVSSQVGCRSAKVCLLIKQQRKSNIKKRTITPNVGDTKI